LPVTRPSGKGERAAGSRNNFGGLVALAGEVKPGGVKVPRRRIARRKGRLMHTKEKCNPGREGVAYGRPEKNTGRGRGKNA